MAFHAGKVLDVTSQIPPWHAGPSAEDVAAGLPRNKLMPKLTPVSPSPDGRKPTDSKTHTDWPSVISVSSGGTGSLRIRIKVPARCISATGEAPRKRKHRPDTPCKRQDQEEEGQSSPWSRGSKSGRGKRKHASSSLRGSKRHRPGSDFIVDRHAWEDHCLDSTGEHAWQRLRAAFMNFCLVREQQAGASWARCDYWGFEISEQDAQLHLSEYAKAVKAVGCLSPVTRAVLRRSLESEWQSLRRIRSLRCGRDEAGILKRASANKVKVEDGESSPRCVTFADTLQLPAGPRYS